LARDIFEEGDFSRLPILGDALEEAGCTNQPVLDHCREGGRHTLGCWVLEFVLGAGGRPRLEGEDAGP
jgi:hypothetical protein